MEKSEKRKEGQREKLHRKAEKREKKDHESADKLIAKVNALIKQLKAII